jgi:hypothetical protein
VAPATGTVQFNIDGTNFGSPVTLSGGNATSNTISTLAVGNHTITAAYSGNTNIQTSSGTLEQKVGQVSFTIITSVQSGSASAAGNGGVAVALSGSSAPNGTNVVISSANYGSVQPTGTSNPPLAIPQYYDINLSPSSNLGDNAMAHISITNSAVTSQTKMQYWYNGAWNDVSNLSVSGSTISGDIPVLALGGTPLAIGTVSGSATKLAFTTQPSAINASVVNLVTQPVVAVQDVDGNTITSSSAAVTLTITSGTGTSGAVLSGNVTVNAVNGVAAFSGLSINKAGSGYTLTATTGNFTVATSGAFNVVHHGDAKLDGKVDIADVTYVERVILGLDLPTPGCDANGDGKINIGDVTKIERIILGLDP